MFWQVGLTIDGVGGVYNVHPAALEKSVWNNAVEHVMDMAQALYPNSHIELDFVKEYDYD